MDANGRQEFIARKERLSQAKRVFDFRILSNKKPANSAATFSGGKITSKSVVGATASFGSQPFEVMGAAAGGRLLVALHSLRRHATVQLAGERLPGR